MGKPYWVLHEHYNDFGSPMYVTAYHPGAPLDVIEIPYTNIRYCEARWHHEPYAAQLKKEEEAAAKRGDAVTTLETKKDAVAAKPAAAAAAR